MAFSVQSVHEEMFGVTHAVAVERLNDFPIAANLLFRLCGPVFPLSRITREVLIVHAADLLLAPPFIYPGVRGLTPGKIGTPERRTPPRIWSRTI